MITSEIIENSIVKLLADKFPDSSIYRRNMTQFDNKPTFVVNVDLQAVTANKDFLQKDLVVVVQYFEDDKLSFNRNLNAVRDTLSSEIFVNSIEIIDSDKNVIKHLLIKSSINNVIDDILSIRITTDFIDDANVIAPFLDLIGTLHLNEEY